jgi:hypothetical protein
LVASINTSSDGRERARAVSSKTEGRVGVQHFMIKEIDGAKNSSYSYLGEYAADTTYHGPQMPLSSHITTV